MSVYYSIKDLENLTGIKAHTIRMWEQRYNIVKPERTCTNIRLYGPNELKLMLNIALLNNNGYKISKIAKMTAEEMKHKVMATVDKRSRYEDQIAALTVAMIDLDESEFERIMANNIREFGFEETILKVIYPFLSKIGVLWATDSINPAQEHFISNLIRQKLIVGIDSLTLPVESDYPTLMLFLPEGELHEISLLFSSYLIRARGFRVFYFGQMLPMEDLKKAYDLRQPDYLLTIITSVPGFDKVQDYLNQLAETFPNAQILLSGIQIIGQDHKLAENQEVIYNTERLIQFLEELRRNL